MQIRTVLCPLDFSDLSYRALDLAGELARAFGARLVAHHNVTTAGPGAAMNWMWLQEAKSKVTEAAVETRLRAILERVPARLEPEAVLTHGLAAPAILAVQQQVKADLLVLGTHGATSEDHTSVTDAVISDCTCPVLALHEVALDERKLLPDFGAPWTVLVPTDFSRQSLASVDYAFELAATWPMRLHLLHVVETQSLGLGDEPLEEALYLRLRGLVPADLLGQTRCHIRSGEAQAEIANAARSLRADAIVMGGHARGLWRRFMTSDTSRGVLHRTDCPIWFVPGSRAA